MQPTAIVPHLGFNGNCAEAFRFYAGLLGGEITFMMTYGDSPEKDRMPPEVAALKDHVMHATIKIGSFYIMGGDAPPAMYDKVAGYCTNLQFTDPAEGQRVFNALRDGGSDIMPWGETFWSKGFGMCVDRFGQHWMINTGDLT